MIVADKYSSEAVSRHAIRATRFGPQADLQCGVLSENPKVGNCAGQKCEGALREQHGFLDIPRHFFSMN